MKFLKRIFRGAWDTLAALIKAARRRRELRDEICWNKFDAARRHALACGYRIGSVTRIRQNARTGTKGWMQWAVDPHEQHNVDAVWVRGTRLLKGSMLVVSGSYGYGEHHDETVFYISRIEGQIHRRDYDGWRRQEARRNSLSD
jgi:hypothetical protein